MKRAFRNPDGNVLIEWALATTDVLKPDGTPLGVGGTFYLLDSGGKVVESWTTISSAVQEHLSTIAHAIEGDALVNYFHDVAWRHEDEPTLNRSVELAGLRELQGTDAPSEAEIRDAVERHEDERRRIWAERDRRECDRLASFEHGDRLGDFEIDVPANEYLRFDND